MLGRFAVAIGKDLRLLVRDRAGLVFLTLAPMVVITVAGFSLANLYGSNPHGANAYVLPFADEDAGEIGRKLREQLAREPAVQLRPVATREAARALVRTGEAGAALSIPSGTSLTIAGGGTSRILFHTDPVKAIEVANLRALVQELRHSIEQGAHERARGRLRKAQKRALAARARFESVAAEFRERLALLPAELTTARAETEHDLADARTRMERELRKAASTADAEARTRLRAELASLRDFLNQTAARRQELVTWLDGVQKRALLSTQIPPPPSPPALPRELAALAAGDVEGWLRRVVPPTAGSIKVPTLSDVDLPEPPVVPDMTLPRVPKIPRFKLPGTLEINEISATGAPIRLNTFDQNVPGFSVTFLLLGMLLGISLGLLDERDWGTLERLRATPTPFSIALVAKLVARFLVGVAQMIILFAVGWAVFGISLGPQPWALLLPTTGIVFAGTAFGLIVAGLASSREAVLPLGSMVIITMAAVGGCWWPIELEPSWMRRLALVFPTTWAMAAYNNLMIRQQPVETVLRATAVLYCFGSLYLALGLALFRRRSFS